MTAPSDGELRDEYLANRAVPHMRQSQNCTPNNKVPSARTIARMMTDRRDHLSRADTVTVAAIADGVPALDFAAKLITQFQATIRAKAITELDPWLAATETSLIAAFARGIARDRDAVQAAITEP
ncbi:hypothetical protein RPD_3937 [Rhodopseudomonas palustris BisB5]|uniref:Uncharacterized protein n=1 Tax=Rhodopseudomonas palustris (strain BisB5) TaxID=316057 RepID=Q131T1_RHOPS|nr:hypothetical protein RPD_3937 [Rhodopseudomonas palustris BisB5]